MKYITLLLTFLLGATVIFAQGPPAPAGLPEVVEKFSGTYEGTLKEQRVTLQLKTKDGKFEGRLQNGDRAYDLTEGFFSDGTLSLNFGKEAKLVGKLLGDKIIGELTLGAEKSPIELRTAVPSSAATPAATAAAPVNLSGQWEAVADANGQPFPFLLVLKVEGENVSGSSSSQLGEATIKAGSWKDGRLVFELEGQNGTIAMSAIVIEGKLSGEFDFAGQLQGRWVAVKKN